MATVAATSTSAVINFREVSIRYHRDRESADAVRDFNAVIRPGEFVSILGPSGCGKSTILNAVAGIHTSFQGTICVDGNAVQQPGRDRGFVFQQHSLFPWQTVRKNIEFGLRLSGMVKAERTRIVEQALADIGLSEWADAYPAQLSGGMKQRVELARALVNKPRVLLMDEPFAALDAQTRLQMHQLVLSIWERHHITVLFVTHDVDEAILLSDRVLILSQRPATLKADVAIPLPRPRSVESLTDSVFTTLKRHCFEQLRTA